MQIVNLYMMYSKKWFSSIETWGRWETYVVQWWGMKISLDLQATSTTPAKTNMEPEKIGGL